jgi:hypothetical protein
MSQTHKMQEQPDKQFLKNIIATQKAKIQNSNWVTIQEPSFIKLIFESLGDEDKKNILNTVLDEPRIISEILVTAKIPQTSGYRKVNALIDNGLLIVQGYVTTFDGKKVTKYRSIFENIEINIEKNGIHIKILPSKEPLESSPTIKARQCRRERYDLSDFLE